MEQTHTEKLKELVGQRIELFDSSGGILDGSGKYITNWWDISPIILDHLNNKYFVVKSGGFFRRHKIKNVVDVSKNHVTLQ